MNKWIAYGEYVTAGKLQQIESYEESFDLGEDRLPYARAIIQNGLITDRLRKSKKNFHRVQTCQIQDDPESVEGKGDIELEKLLAESTDLGCIPPGYGLLGSDKLRKDSLSAAITAKKARVKKLLKKQGKSPKGDGDWV